MKIIIKKARVCLILVLSLLVFFTSCVSKYIPNMVNTPMFTNAGEFQGTIAYGSDFNTQLGYAITDHIAVMANGNYGNEDKDEDGSFRELYFIEGGLGYYSLFSSYGRFEVFGGYGIGEINILEYEKDFVLSPKGIVHDSYSRFFIQPGIGFKKKIFEGNIATRIVAVQLLPGERILTESWNFLIEPAITVRVGFKHVKGVLQYGYSFPLNGDLVNETPFDEEIYQSNLRFFVSIGLNFNIGRK